MLAPTMDLEADLRIDSIKRVEILSAVRDRAPELPDVDTATMATLHTLGQVIEHLRASLGVAPAAAPAPLAAPIAAPAPAPVAAPLPAPVAAPLPAPVAAPLPAPAVVATPA